MALQPIMIDAGTTCRAGLAVGASVATFAKPAGILRPMGAPPGVSAPGRTWRCGRYGGSRITYSFAMRPSSTNAMSVPVTPSGFPEESTARHLSLPDPWWPAAGPSALNVVPGGSILRSASTLADTASHPVATCSFSTSAPFSAHNSFSAVSRCSARGSLKTRFAFARRRLS